MNIHSAFDIPGAVPTEKCQPAIRIAHGRQNLFKEQATRGRYVFDGETLLIRSTVGGFYCVDGCQILVELEQDCPRSEVAHFISSLALPAMLWMRGTIVLHGGAAILPGQEHAVVFLGGSGSGKSTVLRQLAEIGARIVADDAVSLRFEASKVLVSGLPGLLWMRSGGAAIGVPRTRYVVPEAQRADAAPLGAFVILASRETGEGAIEPLDPNRAMAELLRVRYRPNVPSVLGRSNQALPALAHLAERMPTCRWQRQEGRLALSSNELSRIRWPEN